MKTKKALFISYEDAIHICDKNQYREASILELIKLNLRMIHCRMTRRYSRKNSLLTKVLQKNKSIGFTMVEKQDMRDHISKYLSN